MAPPSGIGVIDTMIGFPDKDFAVYDFIRNQLKDGESTDFEFPVEYMFKNVPKELYGSDADPIEVTLGEMDRFGIEYGLIGCEGEQSQRPHRTSRPFHPAGQRRPQRRDGRGPQDPPPQGRVGHQAVGTFPVGCTPQVPIDSRCTTRSTRRAVSSTSRSSCAPACPAPAYR